MIKFNSEQHKYTVDGEIKPSVSQIISWALHEDLSSIPEDLLRRATEWGTAVHKNTQLNDWGMLDLGDLPEVMVKSIQAWDDFVKDYDIIEIEKMYYADGYCGTIDRVLEKDGKIYIVDIKTSSTLRRKVGLQLSAYANLYGHNNNVAWDDMTLLAVQINQHGEVKVKEYNNEYDVFKAMLKVYEWDHKYRRK